MADSDEGTVEIMEIPEPVKDCLNSCIEKVVQYLSMDRSDPIWCLVKHRNGFTIIETKLLQFNLGKEEKKVVQYNGPLEKKSFDTALLMCFDKTIEYCGNMKKGYEQKENDKVKRIRDYQLITKSKDKQSSTPNQNDSNEIQYLFDAPLKLGQSKSKDDTNLKIWTLVKHKTGFMICRSDSLKCYRDEEEIPLEKGFKVVHKIDDTKFSNGIAAVIDVTYSECNTAKTNYIAVEEVAKIRRQKLVEPHFIKNSSVKKIRQGTTFKKPTQSSFIKSRPMFLPHTSSNMPKIPKRNLYSWEKDRPTTALYNFQLHFQKPEAIQDPIILNSFINLATHMAPADVNCQSLPMNQSGWYSLLTRIDTFKSQILKKCPKTVKEKYSQKFDQQSPRKDPEKTTSIRKDKYENKKKESYPKTNYQDQQYLDEPYDPEFPGYDSTPIQKPTFQMTTDSLEQMILNNSENLVELENFLAEKCPATVESDKIEQILAVPNRPKKRSATIDNAASKVVKKLKSELFPVPLYKDLYTKAEFIEIDAFYRIQRWGIISSSNSIRDSGDLDEPSNSDPEIINFSRIAKALLKTHPVLHCPKYINSFHSITLKRIGHKKFLKLLAKIEMEVRARVLEFIITKGPSVFPKAKKIEEVSTQFCRNKFSLKRNNSPDNQRMVTETMQSIASYTQCRLPKILTTVFEDKVDDLHHWLGVDNIEWEPLIHKLQDLRENEETGSFN